MRMSPARGAPVPGGPAAGLDFGHRQRAVTSCALTWGVRPPARRASAFLCGIPCPWSLAPGEATLRLRWTPGAAAPLRPATSLPGGHATGEAPATHRGPRTERAMGAGGGPPGPRARSRASRGPEKPANPGRASGDALLSFWLSTSAIAGGP